MKIPDGVKAFAPMVLLIGMMCAMAFGLSYGFDVTHKEQCVVGRAWVETTNGYGAQDQRMQLGCPSGTYYESVNCIGVYSANMTVTLDFHRADGWQPTVEATLCR